MLENSTSTRFVAPQLLSDKAPPATGAKTRVSRKFRAMENATDALPRSPRWTEKKENITKVERWFRDARERRSRRSLCVFGDSLRHENLGEIEPRRKILPQSFFINRAREKFVVEVNRNSEGIEESFILMDFRLIIRGKRKSDLIYAVLVAGSTRKRLPGPETRNYWKRIVKFHAAPAIQTVNAN